MKLSFLTKPVSVPQLKHTRVTISEENRVAKIPMMRGDRKALHGSCGDRVENDRRNQCSNVRIDNRGKGFLIGGVDCGLQRFTCGKFLSQSLVDEHVCIDCDTNGQDDSRDTWKGQSELEQRHRSEDDRDADAQSDDGENAGEAVVEKNEEQRQGKATNTCNDSLLDRSSTHGWGDEVRVFDLDGVFEWVLKCRSKLVRLFLTEVASDGASCREWLSNHRRKKGSRCP